MYKLLLAFCVAALAFAEPEPEAKPWGYRHHGHYPITYNSYPNWPGVNGPGFSSTLWGARGKRSAEPGVYSHHGHYPVTYNSYPNWPGVTGPGFSSTLWGARGKRSAEPFDYGHGHYGFYGHGHGHVLPGLAQHHAGGGHSYQAGSHLGKRSAEPEFYSHHGHYPVTYNSYPNWPGVTGPGFSSTLWGARVKRSAEPFGYEHGHHGFYGHGHVHGHVLPGLAQHHAGGGHSYQAGSHLGKRSAEPSYFLGYHPVPYHHGYHHGVHVSALHEPGVAGHPGGATSYVSRSTQGLGRKRREAMPTN